MEKTETRGTKMSKYNFKKGSAVNIYVPLTYKIDFMGEDDDLSLICESISNMTYSICNWLINVTRSVDEGIIQCALRKQIKQNEIGIMRVRLTPTCPKWEYLPSIQLSYTRNNSLYEDSEVVTIPFAYAMITINSTGLIETTKAKTVETISEEGAYPQSTSQKIEIGNQGASGVLSAQDEVAEIQQLKKKLQDLEGGIQFMNKEIEQLRQQIQIRETTYRQLEKDIHKRKRELQQKIEDLNKLQENGELDYEKIREEYNDRMMELQIHFGDTKFALEKLLQHRKMDYTISEIFARVEDDLKKLDEILIQMVCENEKESKNLAAAIFNNDGKVVM